jgi:beta-carotene isomerase
LCRYAAVVSEAMEWFFGPTTRETLAGPNGTEVTVVNVKKCRYLEATGCAGACTSMCKLPVGL